MPDGEAHLPTRFRHVPTMEFASQISASASFASPVHFVHLCCVQLVPYAYHASRNAPSEAKAMTPDHISSVQWSHAMGVARQTCARFFRDGGRPADALRAFGLAVDGAAACDWCRAVERVAEALCAAEPMRRAA
jgi:hypothetical protein